MIGSFLSHFFRKSTAKIEKFNTLRFALTQALLLMPAKHLFFAKKKKSRMKRVD